MATATLAWEHFGGNTSSGEVASPAPKVSGGRNLIDSLDQPLVSRCLGGDEAAWEELVRQHTRQVYGLCFRFTNSAQEAQDLTQDVFLRVFKTIKTFRSTEGSFHTWLARVTRNLLIDHYRRTRQERVTDSIEEQLPDAGGRGRGRLPRVPTRHWPGVRPARSCRRPCRSSRRICGKRSSCGICRKWNTGRSPTCWTSPKAR